MKPALCNYCDKKQKTEAANVLRFYWSELLDSNQRPLEPHSSAIPNFAKPGKMLASLDCSDILAHQLIKIKCYFHFS